MEISREDREFYAAYIRANSPHYPYEPGPAPTGECPACGSSIRAEPCYVPGSTGMPVTCGNEWHDEEEA